MHYGRVQYKLLFLKNGRVSYAPYSRNHLMLIAFLLLSILCNKKDFHAMGDSARTSCAQKLKGNSNLWRFKLSLLITLCIRRISFHSKANSSSVLQKRITTTRWFRMMQFIIFLSAIH